MTRAEHLAWCKQRALAELEADNVGGAIAGMISDLQKADEPLYEPETFQLVVTDGLMFCKTVEQVKHWIEGFG